MEWQVVESQKSYVSDLRSTEILNVDVAQLSSGNEVFFNWLDRIYLVAGAPNKLLFRKVQNILILLDQLSDWIKIFDSRGNIFVYLAAWDQFMLTSQGRFIAYSDSGLLVVDERNCCHVNFLMLNFHITEIDFSNIGTEVLSLRLRDGKIRIERVSDIVNMIGISCKTVHYNASRSEIQEIRKVYQF
jgi:hypothetical protein